MGEFLLSVTGFVLNCAINIRVVRWSGVTGTRQTVKGNFDVISPQLRQRSVANYVWAYFMVTTSINVVLLVIP